MHLTPPDPTARFLHIGDLHYWHLGFRAFLHPDKRFLGAANLSLGGRARRFQTSAVPTLLKYARSLNPDALFFSGDFTSISAPDEYRQARDHLAAAFNQSTALRLAVPGNHDCYIPSEIHGRSFVRYLGKVATAVPSSGWFSVGLRTNLFAFNACTRNGLGSHGLLRNAHCRQFEKGFPATSSKAPIVILCHFPPEDPPGVLPHDRGIQLREAEKFLALLESTGRQILWCHGHHHYRWVYRSPKHYNIVYLNAGSPTIKRKSPHADLGFHELLEREEGLSLRTHHYLAGAGRWVVEDIPWPEEAGEYRSLEAMK